MRSKELTREELAAKNIAEDNTGCEMKMNSDECITYKKSHDNCRGCQYEAACSKMVALLLATFSRTPYSKFDEVLKADMDTIKDIDFDFDE